MSEELKPCPFCGQQDAFVEQLDSDASVVICQGIIDEHSACLARGPVGVQQSEMEDQPGRDAAIAEWSRRAHPAEAEGVGDWSGLRLAAKVAKEDGPWEPRLGMTNVETEFAQSASPTKVLELIAALSAVTAELDRELAELSVESYRLTYELNLLQKQVKKAVSDEDRYRLMDESDEVSAKIGQVEAKRHQKLQQLAALQGQR